MVRLTGLEMTAIEKILRFSQFPREGASKCLVGTQGGTRVGLATSGWEIWARMFHRGKR